TGRVYPRYRVAESCPRMLDMSGAARAHVALERILHGARVATLDQEPCEMCAGDETLARHISLRPFERTVNACFRERLADAPRADVAAFPDCGDAGHPTVGCGVY